MDFFIKSVLIPNIMMGVLGIPHGDTPQVDAVPHVVIQDEEKEGHQQESSSLFTAIREGRYGEAHALIDGGADVTYIDPISGKSVLALAAELGKKRLVYRLISKGADPNQSCPRVLKRTALFFAAENNKIDTVRVLLGLGATVDVRDGNGCTALMVAVQAHSQEQGRRDTKMIELLLAKKADPVARNKKGRLVSFYTQDQEVKALLNRAQGLGE